MSSSPPNETNSDAPKTLLNAGVEIAQSVGYSRARRNLLFCTSLLFILGVLFPNQVGLPGFGETKIDGILAIIFAFCANTMFAWELVDELLLTHARNRERFAGEGAENLDTALHSVEREIQQQINTINVARETAEKVVNDLRQRLPINDNLRGAAGDYETEIIRYLRSIDPVNYIPDHRAQAVIQELIFSFQSEFRDKFLSACVEKDILIENVSKISELNSVVENAKDRTEELKQSIISLSRKIYRFQTLAFVGRDTYGIGSFFGATMMLAIYRFVSAASQLPPPDWLAICWGGVGAIFGLIVSRRLIHQKA